MSAASPSAVAVAVSRARVLSGYRRLFRARKKLFQGDTQAMRESRTAIKAEFVKNKQAPTAGPHFEGLLQMVDEAEDMLVHGIVRGNLNPTTGHYEVKIDKEHVEGADGRPMVEQITPDVVSKMENRPNQQQVEVTKCGGGSIGSSCSQNKDEN